jgi:hypothetical protein
MVRDGDRRTFANVVRELIATANDRSDQVAVGSQRLSQDRNCGLEIVFFDNPPRPHTAHQVVLAYDRSPGLDERHQQVEDTAAHIHPMTIGKQLPTLHENLEPAKFDAGRATVCK